MPLNRRRCERNIAQRALPRHKKIVHPHGMRIHPANRHNKSPMTGIQLALIVWLR